MTRFTASDVDRASWDWLCSCGPAALAAICDLTLDEVKPHFRPAFPGYTNPGRMFEALRRTGRKYAAIGADSGFSPTWPSYGLARVQWHGPWTAPGANPRWAYTHTHWVGVCRLQLADGTEDPNCVCVWDVNQLSDAPAGETAGWAPLSWWAGVLVPKLTAEIKRTNGGWHITHAIEVER
jgi:hypothetical protein